MVKCADRASAALVLNTVPPAAATGGRQYLIAGLEAPQTSDIQHGVQCRPSNLHFMMPRSWSVVQMKC